MLSLLYGGYKPQRIWKGGTPMPFPLTGPHRSSEHTPEQYKCHKHEQHLNRKRISVYQVLSLRTGYQANFSSKLEILKLDLHTTDTS